MQSVANISFFITIIAAAFTVISIILTYKVVEESKERKKRIEKLSSDTIVNDETIARFSAFERKIIIERYTSANPYEKSLITSLNIVLNKSLFNVFWDLVKKMTQLNDTKELYLTSLIVKYNSKLNTTIYLYVFSGLLIYFVLCLMNVLEFSFIILGIGIFIFTAVFVRQLILVYRIKQGVYGSTETEARELLEFILKEENKDFFDDNGQKVLFTNENLADIEVKTSKFSSKGARV